MTMKKYIALLLLSVSFAAAQNVLLYRNTALPFDVRATDLVGRLTLEEKVSQMVYNSPAIPRLGIPEYNWWNEGLHGVARNGIATVFPQAIGLAATWDTELQQRVGTVISDEARAKYNRAMKKGRSGIYEGISLWSPNVNIFRDPRWGRGMETYGEDPFLTGEMGVAFIKGLQGNDPRYLKTIATPKHIAVHSGPEPERHTFNAEVSDYDLRETYLAQFRKCVVEGHAASIMCAYNRLRGEGCCGSTLLEQRILREEWGFNGLVVSDCWAVPDMYNFHKIVNSMEEAAAVAVRAGTDLECGNSYPNLVTAASSGKISTTELDTALRRVFIARMRLGMFDPPAMVPFSSLDAVDTKENQRTALEAARKSIVLLKNDARALPLAKSVKNIAVIGPNANDVEVLLGNYNGFPSHPVTPLQGIRTAVPSANVVFEQGCDLAEGMPSFDVIDADHFFTSPDRAQHGLTVEYFTNKECAGSPLFTRTEPKIDAAWWDGSPDPRIAPDSFSVRWSGVLVPTVTGRYALGGYGFNGFRIYLQDTLFAKFDGEFDPVKTYDTLRLTAGTPVKFRVEFYKKLRYAFMQAIWSAPDADREQRAVAAAKKADVVVMVMGLSPRLEGEEMKVELDGFKGGDRTTLELPAVQSRLIKKVHAVAKKVILVLLNGSAVAVNWENEHLPAIVEAWYPGQSAGTALADILFGDVNPSGKLPVTFYSSVDQLPPFRDYDMKGRTYRYFTGTPLYPFGHGLSYTTFEFPSVKTAAATIGRNDSTQLTVEVKNSGPAAGETVVQLYVKAAKDVRSVRTLKAFRRIALAPGETKKISFSITPAVLSRWIDGNGFSVEPDRYTLSVGSSSEASSLKDITLTVQ